MEPAKADQCSQVMAESYPDPNASLTTLTAPVVTSVMDMTSYHQPPVTSYDLQTMVPQSSHYYYADFDWQTGGESGAVPDPSSHYYGLSDRGELPSVQQLYHAFTPQTDPYPGPSSGLWHPQSLVEDPAIASRYLPGMSRSTRSTASASSSSASSPSSSSSAPSKPKRRRVQSVPQRKAANIRERRRMFHLNTAFDELRKRLPAFNYEKRLSRIETLRLAMTYIGFMKDVAMGEDPQKVKLRPSSGDESSEFSQMDMDSCASDDHHHDDVDS